ncbi:MAG: hypothetical protein ACFFD1_03125 [Candidatus Thorarchaeota archaeon]
MLDRILNTDYYKSLVQKFAKNVEFNSSLLPISNFSKINLSFVQKAINKITGFDLIIKIPNYFDSLLDELYYNLYLYLANTQFYENYTNPDFKIGDLLFLKNDLKSRKYKIENIIGEIFIVIEQKRESLKDLNGPAEYREDKKIIIKKFVPIKRKMKKRMLNNYFKLFGILNNLNSKVDYFPTKFNSVSIIIGSKKLFENFRNVTVNDGNLYNSIPCYYINRDGKESDTLGIAPLLYFVPSYRIAYQQIIQNKINVSNIVLFNDGFDELQQIIGDQFEYGFQILGICTSPVESRVKAIKYWEWYKEEINQIESS